MVGLDTYLSPCPKKHSFFIYNHTGKLNLLYNEISLWKISLLFRFLPLPTSIPCKEIRISDSNKFLLEHCWENRNPGKFCLWNPQSWALASGIQPKVFGIPLIITIGIQNSSSTDKNWNPRCGARVAQWKEHSPSTNVARVRNSLSLKTSTSKFQFDLERSDTFQQVLKWSVGKQIT